MKQLVQVSRDLAGLVGQGAFVSCGIEFTIAAEASNAVDVFLQLTDANGDRIKANEVPLQVWFGVDTPDVYTAHASVPTSSISTPASGVIDGVTNQFWQQSSSRIVYTDANGLVCVRFTYTTGALTARCCVMVPGGKIYQSGTMTWT